MNRNAFTVAVLPLLLAGCGNGVDTGECREAATAQAETEQVWASVIEAHNTAHGNEQIDHDELDELLFTSRVDVIEATEATRKACS